MGLLEKIAQESFDSQISKYNPVENKRRKNSLSRYKDIQRIFL